MGLKTVFDMGEYSFYVWAAYAITLVIFVFNVVKTVLERKQVKKILHHYFSQVSQQK